MNEIHWHNPTPISDELRLRTEEFLHDLARDHTDLIDVWVEIDRSGMLPDAYDVVKVRCEARGKEIVVQERDDNLETALHAALDVFEREVREMRGKRADRIRPRAEALKLRGIIDGATLEADHGFITTDDGRQVYFHRNALKDLDFDTLGDGQRVALNVEPGIKGPHATVVEARSDLEDIPRPSQK